MQVGVVGLILAAVFAAAMSTQSSSLNSLAGAAVNDFYKPLVGDVSDQNITRVGKLATIVFGVLQMGVAIWVYKYVSDRSTIDNVLQIAAFMYGPVLGLFFLAILQKRPHPWSSLFGFACGIGVLILLKVLSWGDPPSLFVGPVHFEFGSWRENAWAWAGTKTWRFAGNWLFVVNGLWYTMIGSLITLVVGMASERVVPHRFRPSPQHPRQSPENALRLVYTLLRNRIPERWFPSSSLGTHILEAPLRCTRES